MIQSSALLRCLFCKIRRLRSDNDHRWVLPFEDFPHLGFSDLSMNLKCQCDRRMTSISILRALWISRNRSKERSTFHRFTSRLLESSGPLRIQSRLRAQNRGWCNSLDTRASSAYVWTCNAGQGWDTFHGLERETHEQSCTWSGGKRNRGLRTYIREE